MNINFLNTYETLKRDLSDKYLPSLSSSLMKMASTKATVVRANGLNIEGYVGPLSATAHEIKQKVAAVDNAPCINRKLHRFKVPRTLSAGD